MVLSSGQPNVSGHVTPDILLLAQCPAPCDDQILFAHLSTRLLLVLFSCTFSMYFLLISRLVLWLIIHLLDKALLQGADLRDQNTCDL